MNNENSIQPINEENLELTPKKEWKAPELFLINTNETENNLLEGSDDGGLFS